jgi:hypothetical protein
MLVQVPRRALLIAPPHQFEPPVVATRGQLVEVAVDSAVRGLSANDVPNPEGSLPEVCRVHPLLADPAPLRPRALLPARVASAHERTMRSPNQVRFEFDDVW